MLTSRVAVACHEALHLILHARKSAEHKSCEGLVLLPGLALLLCRLIFWSTLANLPHENWYKFSPAQHARLSDLILFSMKCISFHKLC